MQFEKIFARQSAAFTSGNFALYFFALQGTVLDVFMKA
jgi:hypothetical protein